MISEFSYIDAIYQLISLFTIFGLIGLIIYFIVNSAKNNKRLARMEDKIDSLKDQLNNRNN
ncbi:hypothetical protein [Evansella halocellulosilytica]|uniref:hypothetical protein n=1 Tax=Evansella halocellulosilytica TaxID=2011013 RepID=UPI000BB6F55C|nr:hypothetical protein [Evansella halocellulosilytica]